MISDPLSLLRRSDKSNEEISRGSKWELLSKWQDNGNWHSEIQLSIIGFVNLSSISMSTQRFFARVLLVSPVLLPHDLQWKPIRRMYTLLPWFCSFFSSLKNTKQRLHAVLSEHSQTSQVAVWSRSCPKRSSMEDCLTTNIIFALLVRLCVLWQGCLVCYITVSHALPRNRVCEPGQQPRNFRVDFQINFFPSRFLRAS
jgi:hypothetical protein